MKLRKNKKGFTIVELVIVIAVIGVLAAVLVPTFVNLTQKANEAADTSLVKNLNTALKMEEQEAGHVKAPTLQGAIDDLEKQGFLLENLVAKSGKDLLWDQEINEFDIDKDGTKSGKKYWKIVSEVPAYENQKFSYYAGKNFNTTVPNIKYGFDAGKNANISNIKYTGDAQNENQSVNIRTNGGTLTVDANDHVEHYGVSLTVNVDKVSDSTYIEHGSVANLNIAPNAKKVEIKPTAVVTNYKNENATLVVVNEGYVVHVVAEAKQEGGVTESTGDIKVYTFDQLQSLALASAIGTSVNGKTIQLQNDIDMNGRAWVPFGFDFENAYSGTIDGNGKTIKGMKYTYTEQIETFKSTSEEGTPYGLISYGKGDITIKNLTIEADLSDALAGGEGIACFLGVYNNLINSTTQENAFKLTFDHCTAKGQVAGKTKVGGFIGTGFITQNRQSGSFAYDKVGKDNTRAKVDIKFDTCVNEANVLAQRNSGVKAGGFAGCLPVFRTAATGSIGGGSLTIAGACVNKGNVEANSGTSNKYVAYGPFCGYVAGTNATIDHSTFVDEKGISVDVIRNTNNGSKGMYLDSGVSW